jgi:hypothetical protein
MTVVAIKDQKTMFPFYLTFCMRNEVFLKLINANFVTRPAVWTNVKSLMFWKVVELSFHKVFAFKDNVWWERSPGGANCFNNSHLFAITSL